MDLGTISFSALVPAAGFRWIYRDPHAEWHMREPPDDWSEADYKIAEYSTGDRDQHSLSNSYFLVASIDECLAAHADQKTEQGELIYEPNLYLRFASERATPALISKFANSYGLLRHTKAQLVIEREKAENLVPHFEWPKSSANAEFLSFMGEKASIWINAFVDIRFSIDLWNKLQETNNYPTMNRWLERIFSFLGPSLNYQVKMNIETGEIWSEVMAGSLVDALAVQWGKSLTANVMHRQCSECSTWFPIHPGSGRPEKTFCSNACRMRAFRRRKEQKSRRRITVR